MQQHVGKGALAALLSNLFLKEMQLIEITQDDLLIKNFRDGGSADGYLVKGQVVTRLPFTVSRFRQFKPVVDKHSEDARHLFDRKQKLIQDRAYIMQNFTVLCARCHELQDLRNALPDTLTRGIPMFLSLQRTKEPYQLDYDTEQLQKAVEKAEYYLVNKVLYST